MFPWKFIATFFIDQDFKFYKITSHTQPTQNTLHPVTLVPSRTGQFMQKHILQKLIR